MQSFFLFHFGLRSIYRSKTPKVHFSRYTLRDSELKKKFFLLFINIFLNYLNMCIIVYTFLMREREFCREERFFKKWGFNVRTAASWASQNLTTKLIFFLFLERWEFFFSKLIVNFFECWRKINFEFKSFKFSLI